MSNRRRIAVILLVLVVSLGGRGAAGATLGPSLAARLDGLAGTSLVGTVVVAFNTDAGLSPSNLLLLTLTGLTRGYLLPNLGMAAVPATAAQVRSLARNASVRSLWLNDRLRYLDEETRVLTGVDRVAGDPGFTALHRGLPVTGRGIGILINDSGIDATHPDLAFGSHVVQNVLSLLDVTSLTGLAVLPVIEGLPVTDLSGHGTHCAGIAGGSGAASGGRHAGVAPGASLIGFGSGPSLFLLNTLGGFEYALARQSQYNIRVISNSWGSPGPFQPDSPIALASKVAHDRGIVVVFAAGNSGPGRDTMSSDAKSPYVISVAAGTKEGGLAVFSSRGIPKAQRAAGDFNAPTITAPGTGREFAADAGRFTSAVVSARAKTGLLDNGGAADLELDPADLPDYTQLSGTSMSAPFVAGTVALMLSADPMLTPDAVKSILVRTASQMPGTSEYEAGAGYVNVYAAVDSAFHRGKAYGTYGGPLDLQPFRLATTTLTAAQAPFQIDYDPLSLPGPGSVNAITFTVGSGVSILDVVAVADSVLQTGDGNTVGMLLTDPAGRTWSSGLAIPIIETPVRQVSVADPAPGVWSLEVRGLRYLSALPEIVLPTSGAALPGLVAGTITQRSIQLPAIADIHGDPARSDIELALKDRMLDVLGDGLFHPSAVVSRGDFAFVLALNTPLRQSLADDPPFPELAAPLAAVAEAVTADGSTLRDYGFDSTGMLAVSSSSASGFAPGNPVTRLEMAVALVKALGLDAAALARAGSDVIATVDGRPVVVSDLADIPSVFRGYAQLALDRGILGVVVTPGPASLVRVAPDAAVTRSSLATAVRRYRQAYSVGN
jgi:serine protease AprX